MRINNVSSQFPGGIKRVVMIVVQSPCSTEIRCLLPNALNSVSEHTNICMCVLAYLLVCFMSVMISFLTWIRDTL